MGRKTHEKFIGELYSKNTDIEVIGEYNKANNPIKVKCLKCSGEWEPIANSLLRGSGCPYCCPTPRKVLIGFNDVWTTNPELAKLLLNSDDGYKYTQHSSKRTDWKCPDCGNIIRNKSFHEISGYGLSCPKCADGRSYPNKFAFNLLAQLNIEFKHEYSFYNYRMDFYFELNGKKYDLELDGGLGHKYGNSIVKISPEETKKLDSIREEFFKKHGISTIRVDCGVSDLEYIKNSILNSELSNLFNLSTIDWFKCHKYACKSLVKEVCDLWNNGIKRTKDIAKILKMSVGTTIRYLKRGAELGWCDYTVDKCYKFYYESGKCKTTNKMVACLETGMVYKSIIEASKSIIDASDSHISQCCKGKRNTCGRLEDGTKLHWRYVDDIEEVS